jgi:hypothetical protein
MPRNQVAQRRVILHHENSHGIVMREAAYIAGAVCCERVPNILGAPDFATIGLRGG